jgi:hypothetical protein
MEEAEAYTEGGRWEEVSALGCGGVRARGVITSIECYIAFSNFARAFLDVLNFSRLHFPFVIASATMLADTKPTEVLPEGEDRLAFRAFNPIPRTVLFSFSRPIVDAYIDVPASRTRIPPDSIPFRALFIHCLLETH